MRKLVALLVALAALLGATSTASAAPTAAQVNSASTAAQVIDLTQQRIGAQTLDDRLAVQAKANAFNINRLTTSAKPIEQAAAKTLGKRLMGTALPRAAAFLGPWGVAAASAYGAYELCNAVFGCFKREQTFTPATSTGTAVYTAQNGNNTANRTFYATYPSGSTLRIFNATVPFKDEILGNYSHNGPSFAGFPAGKDLVIYRATGCSSTPLYDTQNCTIPTTLPAGAQLYSNTYTFSAGGTVYRAWMIAALVEDNVDLKRTDAGTLPADQRGTLPTVNDATWTAALRAALIANNDVDLAKHIAREVDPEIADPYNPTRTVPAPTTNETGAAYAARLEALGLGYVRNPTTAAGADVTKPAGAVLTTSPAAGATVQNGSTVVITENPGTMPVVLPAVPAHETYSDYVGRLRSAGLVGTVRRVDLTDATLDSSRGPNEAVSTSPTAGTRVAPDAEVAVKVNPETAPDVGTGTGTGTADPDLPPTPTPTFSIGPLNVPTPCSKFPFGVPCWTLEWLQKWSAVGVAPVLELPVWKAYKLRVDLAVMEPVMVGLRGLMLAGCTIGMAWMFAGLAGVRGGSA